MSDLSNITINGVPLEKVLDGQHREEIRNQRQDVQKEISFIVARSRSTSTSSFRNHSGTRTGRGRVIFSAGGSN